MEKNDLGKLVRIAEAVRSLTVEILRMKTDDYRLSGFPDQYAKYYQLVEPIISRYPDYQLEFSVLPKRQELSHRNTATSFISFRSFLDGVIKQETLGTDSLLDQVENEIFIDSSKPFSAYKVIADITSTASVNLKIVDNFIDLASLEFFLHLNTKIKVEILTKQVNPGIASFKTGLAKFISEWGGTDFEIKNTKFFHDRYIIIDDKEVWHVGPSLNYLGRKPAMITKIQDESIVKHIIDLFNSEWSTASIV